MLEGSIRRAGNRVRITAQLIDAATGGHVWAERYDRELTDIFEVQDDVTRRIVDALKVKLTPAEKARIADSGTPTWTPTTACCAAARSCMGETKNREMFEEAIGSSKAIELDPELFAGLCRPRLCHMFDYQNRWSDDPDGSLGIAKRYARAGDRKRSERAAARTVVAGDGGDIRAGLERRRPRSISRSRSIRTWRFAYNVLRQHAQSTPAGRWRRFR